MVGGDLVVAGLFVLVVSAVCSMTEAAFLSLSKLRAEGLTESANKLDRLVGELRLDFDRPLATIVILNNVANVAGMAVTGAIAQQSLTEHFPDHAATAMTVFVASMTLLVIVGGEIVPKTFGEKHPLAVARVAAHPVRVLLKVLSPLTRMIGMLQAPFSRSGGRHMTSEEEIARLTSLGQEQGAIEKQEGELIQRVFKLNDITAEDIMNPRGDMVLLDADKTLGDVADELVELNRRRIPLFRDSRDNIVGILDRTDALIALAKDQHDLKLCDESLCFKPLYVPETMPADRLLVRLQRRPEPIAIVVDEYGETVGLITLEDVLEELVGEIVDDEDLGTGNGVHKAGTDEVLALGKAEVKVVNELLGTEIPNHRTVAGLLLDEWGHIPARGDALEIHGARFEITEVNDRAILRVRIRRVLPEPPPLELE